MRKILGLAVAVALALAAGGAVAQEKIKAGWIYVGPIGDHGWSYQHNQGRLRVEKELGDKVETIFVENVAEGPDAERAIERLARDGAKIIFTTSFGFMEATVKVAKKFPDVKFEHATGYKTADNLAVYNARFHEGRYVIGQIAAKMSKTGTAGYIVSFPIPEVVMGINSFMLGAQSVNPNFKLKIIWVNTWMNPVEEGKAARTLLDQGVDIIVQHTDSTEPLKIAEQRGLHGFGQSHDMYPAAPKAVYTSIIDNWGPYYVARVKAALDGSWKSQESWDGLKQGTVSMGAYTNLPDDVAAMAKDTQAKITSGELHPFKGPIFKQDGTQVIPTGQHLTDAQMLTMDYYVRGIDGTPGQ
jgi:simple sugar transport system substrate-binding protein